MLLHIKRLTKHAFNYSIAQILSRSIGFLLIPILTRFLVPADYGVVSIVKAVVSVLGVVYTMGQLGSWQRFYYDHRDDTREAKEYFGTIVVFIVGSTLAYTALLSTVGKPLFSIVAKDVPFEPYIQMALWTAFLCPLFNLWHRLFQIRERSLIFSLVSIARFLTAISMTLYFIVMLRQGALGVIRAGFYSALVFFIVALFGLSKEIRLRVDLTKLKASLKYGIPFVPHSLSSWITSLSDRLILGHYREISLVGVYDIGYTFGSIMSMIVTAINLAYIPFFMSTAKEKGDEAKEIFSGLATYYMMAILGIAACVSVFAVEVTVVMTAKTYHDAHRIVPIIVFSYVLNGMYYLVANPIFYVKTATKYLPVATLSAAVVNLGLNYLFIPRYGQMGAAYATLISYVSSFLLTWFISHKVYPITFEYKKILLIFLAISPTLTGGLLLNATGLTIWQSILAKLALIFVYPVLLILFRVLGWAEINAVKSEFVGKLMRE